MWAPIPFSIASLLLSFLCEDSQISFLTAHIYIKLPVLPPRISPGTQCKMYWGCLVAGFQGLDPGRWDGADTSHPICCFLQCRCSLEFELSLGSGSDPASELLPPVQDSWYWFHPQFWTFFSVLGGTVSGLVSYPKSHNNIQDRQKGQLPRATISGWVPTCQVLPRRVSFLTSVPLQPSVEFRSRHQAPFHVPCAHPTSPSVGASSSSSSRVFLLGWWFGSRRQWPPLCPSGPGWPGDGSSLAPVIGSPRACDSSWANRSHQSFLTVFAGMDDMVLPFRVLQPCREPFREWSQTCQAALREAVVQKQPFDPYIPLCLMGERPSDFSVLWAMHAVSFFLNESEFRFWHLQLKASWVP